MEGVDASLHLHDWRSVVVRPWCRGVLVEVTLFPPIANHDPGPLRRRFLRGSAKPAAFSVWKAVTDATMIHTTLSHVFWCQCCSIVTALRRLLYRVSSEAAPRGISDCYHKLNVMQLLADARAS